MLARITDRWYAGWFNEDYLDLYAHRNAQEARSVADFIAARLPGIGQGRTLDLGCGAGRHLPYLAQRQPTVGLDLSPWLLDVARQRNPDTPLTRSDMRSLPFRDASFNLVVSLFTSFGYFADDAENVQVLDEIARVTTPAGWLVLDFLNAPRTRHTLVPFERKQVGERWVSQSRAISADGRYVTKNIHIEENDRDYVERVRLFEPDELMKMLRTAGLNVVSLHGDYAGGGWTADSPRAIVVAQRRRNSHLTLVSTNDADATDNSPALRRSAEVRTRL